MNGGKFVLYIHLHLVDYYFDCVSRKTNFSIRQRSKKCDCIGPALSRDSSLLGAAVAGMRGAAFSYVRSSEMVMARWVLLWVGGVEQVCWVRSSY